MIKKKKKKGIQLIVLKKEHKNGLFYTLSLPSLHILAQQLKRTYNFVNYCVIRESYWSVLNIKAITSAAGDNYQHGPVKLGEQTVDSITTL